MGIGRWLRRRPEQVTFDAEGVTRTMRDGRTEHVRWADLVEVGIVTTDEGPLVDDVFWLLIGETSGCAVPSAAEGCDALVARLVELPGFDHLEMLRAMGSCEDARFVCWRRG